MTVHVIGAGMAGLAAALRLARAGRPVLLHEQARHAGGRCGTFHDPVLGRPLDSGIHLHFSGQRHLHAFLADIGQPHALVGLDQAACRFVDDANGRHWLLQPTLARMPLWLLVPWRAAPGTGLADLACLAALARAGPADTVARLVPARGPSRRLFWEPLCIAALNTEPACASAQALWQVLRGVLSADATSLYPRFARQSLAASLVDPAIAALLAMGGQLRFGSRLRAIESDNGRATLLRFAATQAALGPGDSVVLAVPSGAAARLLPDLALPQATRAIVSAHFLLSPPGPPGPALTTILADQPLWLLARGDLATVTVGAANALLDLPAAALARHLWLPVARALSRPPALPAWRVTKFRHATHAHSPAGEALRPPARTALSNLFLAGDWTRTGQSASVEGAILSGHEAATSVMHA